MRLDPLFDALEQRMADDISVESLAETGLLSRSQLYREFYSTAGHSVKEYVRKRRLSAALALIKHSGMSLSQVAQGCGFGSVQALCKSVKAATGLTPSRYKVCGEEYYFPPAASRFTAEGQRAHTVAVSSESIPQTRCLRYYDSCLQGIENRALEWFFSENPRCKGRIFGRNGRQAGSKFCYELYIESRNATHPATKGTFAKTTCPNNENAINTAWNYLYNSWLKTSMFVLGDVPYFEEHIHSGGQVLRLQLYLPVIKRPGFHKIRLTSCKDMHFLAANSFGENAEKEAAQTVMNFLSEHDSPLAQNACQFYVSAAQGEGFGLHLVQEQSSTSGIAIPAPIMLPKSSGVQVLTRSAGIYALLEGDCCGDAGAYESVLCAWIDNSTGLVAEGAPFAVYETDRGFGREDVRVKIYQKIRK